MKKPTGLSKVRDVFLEVGVGWSKRLGTMSSCQPSHVTVEVCRLKGSDPRVKGVDRLLGLRSYRCGVGALTKGRGLGPSAHVEAGIHKEDLGEQGCVEGWGRMSHPCTPTKWQCPEKTRQLNWGSWYSPPQMSWHFMGVGA